MSEVLMDGVQAYARVLEDLAQPHCRMVPLFTHFPDRAFLYGEDGYGLVLPQRVIYVASGYDLGLYLSGKEPQITPGRHPVETSSWQSIRVIPEPSILEVTSFAAHVRQVCQHGPK